MNDQQIVDTFKKQFRKLLKDHDIAFKETKDSSYRWFVGGNDACPFLFCILDCDWNDKS